MFLILHSYEVVLVHLEFILLELSVSYALMGFFLTQNKALMGEKLGFCSIIETENEKSTAFEYGIK